MRPSKFANWGPGLAWPSLSLSSRLLLVLVLVVPSPVTRTHHMMSLHTLRFVPLLKKTSQDTCGARGT